MPAPETPTADRSVARSSVRLAVRLALIVLVSGAAVFAWFWFSQRRPHPSPEPPPRWPVTVRTIAGSGAPGFADGAWHNARFSDPFGVAVAPNGTVFVSDAGDTHAIRRIDPDGRVSIFCGGREGFDDGDAVSATFRTPSGLALLPDGRLVVADTGNNAIRAVAPDGRVTTIAGDGAPGSEDGVGRSARFNGPVGVAAGPDGSIYVADTYNDRIRRIGPDGVVTTLAGGAATGFRDGSAAEALFDTPSGVAVAANGEVFVADTGNNVVRRIAAGQVNAMWRTADLSSPDGWWRPVGIAVSGPFVYVTDANRVSIVEPGGGVHGVAGSVAGSANGPGDEARFGSPMGITVNGAGMAWVADSDNYQVRRLSPPGQRGPALDIDLVESPVLTPDTLQLPILPWPVDDQHEWHELTATFGEARGSRGGGGFERLHSGVDVKGDIGAIVRAVRDEAVQRPLSTGPYDSTNESLRVGVIGYVHVRVGRDRRGQVLDAGRFTIVRDADDQPLRVRVKRGTRFRAGAAVGTINRQAHVHLQVGPPGTEVNPLAFALPGFADTEPPVILRNGITVFDEAGVKLAARARGRLVVSGRVSVVVDAYDRVNGNGPSRRLGIYAVGYQVLDERRVPLPGFEAPRDSIVFDRAAPDPAAPGLAYSEGSGITAYGTRVTHFRYVATNTIQHGGAARGSWDTTTLTPGNYVVRATVRDYAGNTATQDLEVRVEAEGEFRRPPS